MAKGVNAAPERALSVHLLPALAPANVADRLHCRRHRRVAGDDHDHSCPGGRLHFGAALRRNRRSAALADQMLAGKVILAGERGGEKIAGFDRGNSPREFTPANSRGCTLVLTTSNGTRALLRAAEAERCWWPGS